MSPFPDVPLAPAGFLAKIFYIGLLTQMAAVLVTVGIAENSTASPASTTPRGAPTPFSDDPTSLLDLRLGALARRLPALGQRRGDHQFPRYSAVRGLFADHLALWGWAVLGLAAPPLALRLRANCLAPQRPVFVAVQLALGLVALGAALWGVAIQGLVAHAWILRAEHRTAGITTIHLAPLEIVRSHLGAAGLALGHPTQWLAVLLADGLRAIPSAVGHAALPLGFGDDCRPWRCCCLLLLTLLLALLLTLLALLCGLLRLLLRLRLLARITLRWCRVLVDEQRRGAHALGEMRDTASETRVVVERSLALRSDRNPHGLGASFLEFGVTIHIKIHVYVNIPDQLPAQASCSARCH
mmetsp:Transcript_22471/g.49127  ORF Transcript_22471/g.49127 Transcript_22471/m.49127 type:complete len:355 (-) Transcript_22471:190-1254(-)